jgi:hypothetical protein
MVMRYFISVIVGIAALLSLAAHTTCSPAATPRSEAGSSPGVVVLEIEGGAGISVRMAEELARATSDGTTRRVLPIIGLGAQQNIMDFKLLPSVDVAILQTDVLDYAKQEKLAPGIESWMTYISRLFNEEVHLIARAEIKSISDLADHNVSVDVGGALVPRLRRLGFLTFWEFQFTLLITIRIRQLRSFVLVNLRPWLWLSESQHRSFAS